MKARICGVPEHFNLPWELAVKELAGQGHDVSWTPVPEGSGAMAAALGDGSVDIAVMLTMSTIRAIKRGLKAKVIGTHVKSPLRWGIHVPADSDLHSIEDIQGKEIAISRLGSGSHLIPILDARARGWDASNLSFVEVGTLEGARAALTGGDAEVFFWEQFMTQPLVDSGDFRRLDVRTPPWPAFQIVATEAWLESHGIEEIQLLCNTVDSFASKLADDPEGTASRLSERFSISEEDALVWLNLTDWRCTADVGREGFEAALNELQAVDNNPLYDELGDMIWH